MSDKHIKADLDFLDSDNNSEQPKRASKDPDWVKVDEPSRSGLGAKDKPVKTGYNWGSILLVGGLIVFGIWGLSSSDESATNTSSTPSVDGQYHCSQYDSTQADRLLPSPAEKSEIENEYVDNTSQWSIDNHNAKIDVYNAKIKAYNDYLVAHC